MDSLTPEQVRRWIAEKLECAHLEVRGDGRHFEALVVCEKFAGLPVLRRHRMVYAALGDKMHSTIHALSMRALTPAEWRGDGAD